MQWRPGEYDSDWNVDSCGVLINLPRHRGGREVGREKKKVIGEDICCDERHFVFVKLASLSHLKQTKYLDDSWELGNFKLNFNYLSRPIF